MLQNMIPKPSKINPLVYLFPDQGSRQTKKTPVDESEATGPGLPTPVLHHKAQ